MLLAISTSGDSRNILLGIEAAHESHVRVIGLTGESGGEMRTRRDLCLRVFSKSAARIQEMHITICHAIRELLAERLVEA